ncbi:serine protein kinase RIO [Methanobacterium alcaliphilum]|uniref:serine protein kinase RIO n=1 Tax=Methanobacterium alcaliphilum TaxID=392018 RepID=UPI00200A450B|nr:serine protein kinase RIO [Methanobacterium alcaliphilum]MCK9150362.1 serine protein kinase RIO [Methanobacterium alcaliphilum]
MDPKVSKADAALDKMRAEKRLKSVEDRRVASEVFDKLTLETLYKLANNGYLNILNGAISTGKEANVFKGIHDKGHIVAVKIYRINTSDFKKMQYYIQGDPRFKVRTNNKRQLVNAWVNKEFRNLNRCLEADINVPEPVIAKNNVLLMEFIGDEDGNPAPTLRNQPPEKPEKCFETLINAMKKMYHDAKLVHGDLSGYNILNHNEEPVIIDVSQSVVTDHPISRELLERDIDNIIRDFKKFGVFATHDEIKQKIIEK